MKMRLALLAISISSLTASGCSYNVATPQTFDDMGVARLYEPAHDHPYKGLGLHAWGFYHPGFAEPLLADIWAPLSEKVRALGGNACVVRYEHVTTVWSRTLEATCEVLKI
jgi:hypothetical protein